LLYLLGFFRSGSNPDFFVHYQKLGGTVLKFEPTLTYNKAKNPINPKEEFHIVVMFDFQSGPNEETLYRTFHRRLQPNFKQS
jgi:hypothetical protein